MHDVTHSLFEPVEQEAMTLLLAGELPALQQLRAQIPYIRVVRRSFTAVGVYLKFDLADSVVPVDGAPSFVLSDVSGQVTRMIRGICFVLFVQLGRIHLLEGATFGGEEWPAKLTHFSLGYDDGERDWEGLKRTVSQSKRE